MPIVVVVVVVVVVAAAVLGAVVVGAVVGVVVVVATVARGTTGATTGNGGAGDREARVEETSGGVLGEGALERSLAGLAVSLDVDWEVERELELAPVVLVGPLDVAAEVVVVVLGVADVRLSVAGAGNFAIPAFAVSPNPASVINTRRPSSCAEVGSPRATVISVRAPRVVTKIWVWRAALV